MTLEEYKAFLPRCYDDDDVDFLLELAEKELKPAEYFMLLLHAQDRKKEMRREEVNRCIQSRTSVLK